MDIAKEVPMNNPIRQLGLCIAAALALAMSASSLAQAPAAPAKAAAPARSVAPPTFATAEDAVKALVAAVRAQDGKAIVGLMGPGAEQWIFTGDVVSDKEEWARFLAAYDKKNAITRENDAKAWLVAGDDWPFPVPLVKKGDKWSFDGAAGRQEVTNRRVGRNELDTIQTLLAVVDAQREYASGDPDKNGFNDYARTFASKEGKKDGLYWPTKEGEPQSPLGPLVAQASGQGYSSTPKQGTYAPYNGYLYKILTSQGKDAPGGAYDYVVNGKMIGGFAVVAYPSSYAVSGVMTFVVNHDGVVYESDLGDNTAKTAAAMTKFNPGKGWKKVP